MASTSYNFQLARDIERYLATLSNFYGHKGEQLLQKIIVNAKTRVEEGWSYDNWNGGTYGHALYLTIPEALFIDLTDNKEGYEKSIAEDLNRLYQFQNEFIDKVFFELGMRDDGDWRQESGALLRGIRPVGEEATKRIWTSGQYRLFLSHKSEVKIETSRLKDRLAQFGVSGFVAHADIQPTQEWQNEIENALATMDGFVALMAEDFHDSNWTDQEVGYAFGRGVPIIAAQLGRVPYGFIGKFQGLSCSWDTASVEIVKLLIKYDKMLDAYVSALSDCRSFDQGNSLAAILPSIKELSEKQIDDIVNSYNSNSELKGSFAFNGGKAKYYGPGLLHYLSNLTSRKYFLGIDRELKRSD